MVLYIIIILSVKQFFLSSAFISIKFLQNVWVLVFFIANRI